MDSSHSSVLLDHIEYDNNGKFYLSRTGPRTANPVAPDGYAYLCANPLGAAPARWGFFLLDSIEQPK